MTGYEKSWLYVQDLCACINKFAIVIIYEN